MNVHHKRNKANWDEYSDEYKLRGDRGPWDTSHLDPSVSFLPEELAFFGDLQERRVCVLGSGNNFSVFSLAGMGARVTSVDVSTKQLGHARTRSRTLGLDVSYLTADVVDLGVRSDTFDLVYTGGHVACWVSDLRSYYAEAFRILAPGGSLVVREFHPFFREIWSPASEHLASERPYGQCGPYLEDGEDGDPFVFTWRVSDYVNAVLEAGFHLEKFEEILDADAEDRWKGTQFEGFPDDILLIGVKQ